MKKGLIGLCAIFLWMGCQQPKVEEIQPLVEKETQTFYPFPEAYQGSFINAQYIQLLRESGKARNAQAAIELSTIHMKWVGNECRFSSSWNFHEGGMEEMLRFTNRKEAICKDSDADFKFVYLDKNTIEVVYD